MQIVITCVEIDVSTTVTQDTSPYEYTGRAVIPVSIILVALRQSFGDRNVYGRYVGKEKRFFPARLLLLQGIGANWRS